LYNPPNSDFDWDPKINNQGQITWSGSPGSEIWLADTSLNRTRITSSSLEEDYPVINNQGQIAWMGRPTTSGSYEIYLYTPGGSNVNISNLPLDDTLPSINDLGQVAWLRPAAIAIYDPVGGVTQLSRGATTTVPTINNRGQVVWQEWNGSQWCLYLYDTDKTVKKIADTGDTNFGDAGRMYAVNQDGSVAWRGWDGNDNEIHYCDSATHSVVQVTDNSYDDGVPSLDGSWLTWSAAVGGGHYQIMEAQVPEPGTCGSVLIGGLILLLLKRRKR
jgi:hypothetical protein